MNPYPGFPGPGLDPHYIFSVRQVLLPIHARDYSCSFLALRQRNLLLEEAHYHNPHYHELGCLRCYLNPQ